MLQFESVEALRLWEESPERQRWLQKVEEVAHPAKLATHVTTGLESLFADGRGRLTPVRPPRYKMALVLTCVIYTLLLSLRPLLSGFLVGWPDYLSALVLVSTQVLLMIYLIMPAVTRVFAGWLYK